MLTKLRCADFVDSNKYPGMWRMKDMGSDPAWTLASNGSWIFNGQQVLGAVSSQPLADFIQA